MTFLKKLLIMNGLSAVLDQLIPQAELLYNQAKQGNTKEAHVIKTINDLFFQTYGVSVDGIIESPDLKLLITKKVSELINK
jgi:hypothetical protein